MENWRGNLPLQPKKPLIRALLCEIIPISEIVQLTTAAFSGSHFRRNIINYLNSVFEAIKAFEN